MNRASKKNCIDMAKGQIGKRAKQDFTKENRQLRMTKSNMPEHISSQELERDKDFELFRV